jgi:hypothetical protein
MGTKIKSISQVLAQISSTRVNQIIIRKHACSYELTITPEVYAVCGTRTWNISILRLVPFMPHCCTGKLTEIRVICLTTLKKQLRNDLTAQLCSVLTVPVELLRVWMCHQLGLNVLITETSLSWQLCLQVTFERTIIAVRPMVHTFLVLLWGSRVRIPRRVWIRIRLCMWFSVLCTYWPCDCQISRHKDSVKYRRTVSELFLNRNKPTNLVREVTP